MDTVRDTVNQAGAYASQSLGLGGATQAEEHKSMVDDKVRTGNPGGTHHEGTTGNTTTTGSSSSMGDTGVTGDNTNPTSSSKDITREQQPQGALGEKPQGSNVIGHTGESQNSNPMSNKNEPNTGFGGGSGSAEPSVDAKPQASAGSGGSGSQQVGGGGADGATAGDGAMGGGASGKSGMKLPESKSNEEGTGTKYEKSTGVKAEGGDFDASRPGAGREADRLLDQKGIHHGADIKPGAGDSATDHKGDDSHGKGFGDKVKGKLHHN